LLIEAFGWQSIPDPLPDGDEFKVPSDRGGHDLIRAHPVSRITVSRVKKIRW